MNDELKQKAQDIAVKHMKAMLEELAHEVVLPLADKEVLESSNKIDDLVWASAKVALLAAVEKV